ncbi:(2Fe-2S)-binding protein [Bradyrhizobium sp. SSUT77]|uniref:(2Fe-2S)-binding protein n=1 Tax=Bradyrhizobium sp. SSUT77 TaxID=3040603 RepID=UPI0024473A9A|nr:(2Fe-2S)-binding protein [Bradyrhizobium sp. SSUT77]MDH2341432.1 (2Fe-2S)-binding protein [Bradyrhizobium sp. SSUT77]
MLGADYGRGRELVDALAASGATYCPGSTVFDVSPAGEIAFLLDGRTRLLSPHRILAATGGQERPFPIEGWTLPGVMTAGAAQILLKQADLVPSGKIVLAGTGPLLWLLAAQILGAGGMIALILDTTPKRNWRAALRYLPRFLASPYAVKGLALLARVRRSVKVISGVSHLRAARDLAALERDLAARRFLDALYEPPERFRVPSGDIIVCRCEEIPAHRIEALIAQGVLGPNQLKFFMRCGMGPCQGRLCGLTVTEMFAAGRGVSPAQIGHYRLRTPIKPVTVAEMASLPFGEHADKAVVRL